jgi:hypothetical protein
MLTNILVQNFNEKYKSMDEVERLFLNNLVDGSFESRKEVYRIVTEDCIKLIDEKLKENNLGDVDKLQKVKSKLNEDLDKLSQKNLLEKLSKIIELRNNL